MTRGHDPEPSLGLLREAVREAMGARSIRTVAEEVGISHTGLRGFLNGAIPHRYTRLKLESWLLRARTASLRERGEPYAAESGRHGYRLAEAIVRSIAAQAEPRLADGAAAELAALLRRAYHDAGKRPPPWLADADR